MGAQSWRLTVRAERPVGASDGHALPWQTAHSVRGSPLRPSFTSPCGLRRQRAPPTEHHGTPGIPMGTARREPAGSRARGGNSEAYLPAKRPEALQAPWLPSPDVDPCRASSAAIPPPKGPGQAVGLIWRIRDRSTFVELRRSGVRRRRGPIGVTWIPGHENDPPRVAFAIGRKVGTAVVRNQLRRRLRGAFVELAAEGRVPAGAYLFTAGGRATELTYEELKRNVRFAVESLGPDGSERRSSR